jgi:GT2 family glycosyltransferase
VAESRAEICERARIAAVIVNYRTPDLTLDAVRSLLPQLDPVRDVVVVVDNASGDGSAARIREAVARAGWKGVRLIESAENSGFAGGNNAGLRAVHAEAYLLLNSDALARPGAVEALWQALGSDPAIGAVGPRLEWPDATPQISCFRFLTPCSELIRGSGGGVLGRALLPWVVPLPLPERPIDPPWTSFAAVLLRGDAVRAVGPLDDGYFMYFEDVDYCRRLWRGGWRVTHQPAAHAVHLRGGSSPVKRLTAQRKRRPRYFYEARSRYFLKWYGAPGLLVANLLWTAGRAVGLLRERLAGKEPRAVEAELRDLWLIRSPLRPAPLRAAR